MTYGNTVFALALRRSEACRAHHCRFLGVEIARDAGFRCGWIAASEEFCARALPFTETLLFGSQPFPRGCDRLRARQTISPKSMR